jgi:hypothetical protein
MESLSRLPLSHRHHYGLKSATINIPANAELMPLPLADEFPSGFYSISKWCQANKKELKIIKPPRQFR